MRLFGNRCHRAFKQIVSLLANESGQMSIFIALIFQVLFVFFAMVINVGLLVHDKINLQNAVDLGAYYAAERQAEILNEIAHVNYQIRQDNKLLAWRYRVLGGLGRTSPQPPSRSPINVPLADTAFANMSDPKNTPVVCVTNDLWSDFAGTSSQAENYCKDTQVDIPLVPTVPVIAPFVPGAIAASIFAEQARRKQRLSCNAAGTLNWAFTMQLIASYKFSIATRKTLIYELRKHLVASTLVDQQNQLVSTGVINTIKKNLTQANLASFNENEFVMQNGLAAAACAQNEGDGTISEIRTAPLLYYLDMKGDDDYCRKSSKSQRDRPQSGNTGAWDPSGLLQSFAAGEPEPNGPGKVLFSSLGFEKNPWCMAYVGVKAVTHPYKPFLPLGQPVTLVARAFAQPFGGRIGPWYMELWARGSPSSSGGDRVDPLTTPRVMPSGEMDMTGIADPNNPNNFIPNFSRYPGDHLGLVSSVPLGAQRGFFQSLLQLDRLQRLQLAYYGGAQVIPSTGDPLAWDDQTHNGQMPQMVKRLRTAEISAIAPDLFDATYYSVEPNYFSNYLKVSGRFPNLPLILDKKPQPAPDIGGRNGQDVSGMAQFTVMDQVKTANNKGAASFYVTGETEAGTLENMSYLIQDWHHLLTGWISHKAEVFDFPDQFGTCSFEATAAHPVPGSCAQGGRTGYSVRLISREHLLQGSKWQIGGSGGGSGPILNSPDPLF